MIWNISENSDVQVFITKGGYELVVKPMPVVTFWSVCVARGGPKLAAGEVQNRFSKEDTIYLAKRLAITAVEFIEETALRRRDE